jgi:hypothetical protein
MNKVCRKFEFKYKFYVFLVKTIHLAQCWLSIWNIYEGGNYRIRRSSSVIGVGAIYSILKSNDSGFCLSLFITLSVFLSFLFFTLFNRQMQQLVKTPIRMRCGVSGVWKILSICGSTTYTIQFLLSLVSPILKINNMPLY